MRPGAADAATSASTATWTYAMALVAASVPGAVNAAAPATADGPAARMPVQEDATASPGEPAMQPRRVAIVPGWSRSGRGGGGIDVGLLTWRRYDDAAYGIAGGRIDRHGSPRTYAEIEVAALASPHGDILAVATLGIGPYRDASGERGAQLTGGLWAAPVPVMLYVRASTDPRMTSRDGEVGFMLKVPLWGDLPGMR